MTQQILVTTREGLDQKIASLNLIQSKGFGFKYTHASLNPLKQRLDKLVRILERHSYRLPLKRVTISCDKPIDRLSITTVELALFLGLCGLKDNRFHSFTKHTLFLAGLDLEGKLVPLPYIDAAVLSAKEFGISKVVLSRENLIHAPELPGIQYLGFDTLVELFKWVNTGEYSPRNSVTHETPIVGKLTIIGQVEAKRALELAFVGNHSIILSGVPGIGKTSLCQTYLTIADLLPVPFDFDRARILSLKQLPFNTRRVRTLYTSTTMGQLIGGGVVPYPGELSLAHNGFLFVDELTEQRKTVIEAIKSSLEKDIVVLSKHRYERSYPANYTLVATTNESLRKSVLLSDAFLDRIDLPMTLYPPTIENSSESECLIDIFNRLNNAFQFRQNRIESLRNSELTDLVYLDKWKATDDSKQLVKRLLNSGTVSYRSIIRSCRIARTIADFENAELVRLQDLNESLSLRAMTN